MGVTRGIVLDFPDAAIYRGAESLELPCITDARLVLPFGKTLLIKQGVTLPLDLLPAAWSILEKWDVAIPLAGGLAEDAGTAEEQERTRMVAFDLRIPLLYPGLVFVRDSEGGNDFMEAWEGEAGDVHLALLRAVYRAKPLLCVLPPTWHAKVRPYEPRFKPLRPVPPPSRPMVRVEVAPGRMVTVHSGDEEKAVAQYRRTLRGGR